MFNTTEFIKQKSKELGFLSCGISKAGFLEKEAPKLERWLNNNYHGKMSYMANHFDKRLDPTLLVPGAKSVISLLFNYYSDKKQKDSSAPKISKYAYGKDYHFVIKDRLKKLFELIKNQVGDIGGRVFVDSAPIMEKSWAEKSGLGWVGKNTNLISQKVGSFFFICEIITDLELEYDHPVTDHCGSCTACIDACPTEALIAPYQLDAKKCISYLTIELKDEIFQGDYAIYTRDDNTIKLTGDVSIQSPTRLLTGHELIADIDNNKRILNSANDESLVEVLLENNANN